MEKKNMGKKSQKKMTGLTEQGRIKRSHRRRAEEEKKRKEMEKKVAEQLASAIFPKMLHGEKKGV
jgi:hypothetical protein